MPRARRPPALALVGVSVAMPPGTALLPEECACCGKPSSHRLATRRGDGVSLLVGYCDECAEHQAAVASRGLSLALASLLLGLVTAAGLPLLAPRLGAVGLVLSACVAAGLPLVLLLLPRGELRSGHAAHGRAVIWERGRRLWCANESYGQRVAELNALDATAALAAAMPEQLGSPWLSAGPLVAIGAACLSHFVYHPLLRVINLNPVRVEIALDGAYLVAVEATSNESPSAGALIRVPVGPHVLSVRSAIDGSSLERTQVDLQSGDVHLFAPGSAQTCFWLETTGYGVEQLAKPSYQRLEPDRHFWILPGGIDTWFAPNPAPSGSNSRSSGGLLTALRQAPCTDAPPALHASE